MSRAVFGVLTATVMIAVALLLWWQLRDEVSTIPVESDLELETPTDQTGDRADQPTHDRKQIDPKQPNAEVVAKKTLKSHPGSLVVRVQFSDKTPGAGIGVGFQLVPRYAARRSATRLPGPSTSTAFSASGATKWTCSSPRISGRSGTTG